jgi:hypothetical protein
MKATVAIAILWCVSCASDVGTEGDVGLEAGELQSDQDFSDLHAYSRKFFRARHNPKPQCSQAATASRWDCLTSDGPPRSWVVRLTHTDTHPDVIFAIRTVEPSQGNSWQLTCAKFIAGAVFEDDTPFKCWKD